MALTVLLPVYMSGKERDLPGPFYKTTIAHLKKGPRRRRHPRRAWFARRASSGPHAHILDERRAVIG